VEGEVSGRPWPHNLKNLELAAWLLNDCGFTLTAIAAAQKISPSGAQRRVAAGYVRLSERVCDGCRYHFPTWRGARRGAATFAELCGECRPMLVGAA
jgi:hypothetical protein